MKVDRIISPARRLAFRTWRSVAVRMPGPSRIQAFGSGKGQISSVTVINLDRQPQRLALVQRELGRFRTSDGLPLTSITERLSAIDARDGRSVAATSDVDTIYRVGDQAYVQPDARLTSCFDEDEPVRMTPQEVAVARSHIEVWKAIATGTDEHVLVLEDDIWFTTGAAVAIDRGWHTARKRCASDGGPKLLYLSYSDAGGTAVRTDVSDGVFRPVRGLWFLSGYVLSREGARQLLRAMPVVGPVDMWMNFRFAELGALALSAPALSQRPDVKSDNVYSMLPYLARAGIVDFDQRTKPPKVSRSRPVVAWTARPEREGLAMALSMLGVRVRVFDGNEPPLRAQDLKRLLEVFGAVVDAPMVPNAGATLRADKDLVVLMEPGARTPAGLEPSTLPVSRSITLAPEDLEHDPWKRLCNVLGLAKPVDDFPSGAPRSLRLFRVNRATQRLAAHSQRDLRRIDHSPWILPTTGRSTSTLTEPSSDAFTTAPTIEADLQAPSIEFSGLAETFPGNLASFAIENLEHSDDGARLTIEATPSDSRPYRSAAFASVREFSHGRFEAEIRATHSPGLVTGFFLHRSSPFQEIDIELPGSDPRRMLTNVYFNPGDDGAAMNFGYRGTPHWVDLGFDASAGFHLYAIDWSPGRLTWLVDGVVVHERVSWDPTPIPHLPMRVHANLWAPRSKEIAGQVDKRRLPASATFKRVAVRV